MPSDARHTPGRWILILFTLAAIPPFAHAQATHRPRGAVLPASGTVNGNERRAVVVVIRDQLRHHGYVLATQSAVKSTASTQGHTRRPTEADIRKVGQTLRSDVVVWSSITKTPNGRYHLRLAKVPSNQGQTVVATAPLPRRGLGMYTTKQVTPAVAACIAEVLNTVPNPVHGPFPKVELLNPRTVFSASPTRPPSAKAAATPPADKAAAIGEHQPQLMEAPEDPNDERKKKWERWDHKGIFAELGFAFSWCRGETLCRGAVKGYGGRLRAGVRIKSVVALSVTGMGIDHNMPITTDTEVFLSVKNAFVTAGIFGGIRIHPVRRFVLDPYVGIDFGWMWLLYANNETIDDGNIQLSGTLTEAQAEIVNARRTAVSLQGFTITPELGLNIFLAPPLAVGAHVQWMLPFWRDACARVYDPTLGKMNNTKRVCATIDDLSKAATMAPHVVDILSDEDNLPKFVSVELDFTFIFK